MNYITLPQYLIESSLSLLILYGFYHLVLRKETFFQFNRVYLLLSATFAIVLPFIHISINPQPVGGSLQYDWVPAIDYAQQAHYSIGNYSGTQKTDYFFKTKSYPQYKGGNLAFC